jgi:hypothetical protein
MGRGALDMWKSILGATALAGWVGAASADPLDLGIVPEFLPISVAVSAEPATMDLEAVSFSVVVSAERIASSVDYEISPLAVAATVGDEFETASSVSEGDLGGMAGGIGLDDLQLNSAATTGASSNNTVGDGVQTGQIGTTNISGVAGFSTIMMNTGNNVVMQSTTQVNIILK